MKTTGLQPLQPPFSRAPLMKLSQRPGTIVLCLDAFLALRPDAAHRAHGPRGSERPGVFHDAPQTVLRGLHRQIELSQGHFSGNLIDRQIQENGDRGPFTVC